VHRLNDPIEETSHNHCHDLILQYHKQAYRVYLRDKIAFAYAFLWRESSSSGVSMMVLAEPTRFQTGDIDR
jgi:hypothetical protein